MTRRMITLAGVAWGMVIFGEQHSAYVWAALALTILGIAMVGRRAPVAIRFPERDR